MVDDRCMAHPHDPEGQTLREPTEVLAPAASKEEVRRFRLTVTAGPDAGVAHSSTGREVVVGRDAGAGLVLRDPKASPFHAAIAIEDGVPVLRDLGSDGGTRVNGVDVLEAPLESPSTVAIGDTTIRFDLGSESIALPLSTAERFGVVVGRSVAMRALFAVLERAAASDATVLLEGETGTGKEAIAESIHRASPRAERPLLTVDCGAIPSTLLESELFGHERGAFTGAHVARAGIFEAARGGTVFVDEIGELPSELQPKLLRVIEARTVKRVGSSAHVPVDVRIVAATNRGLRELVTKGLFRADLYYRIAVVSLRVPPLRERRDDVPLLVAHLLESFGPRPKPDPLLARAFLQSLARRSWPGNVRELRNLLERCIALGPGVDDDENANANEVALKDARAAWNAEFEAEYLKQLLAREGGNVAAAARAANVDRAYLYRLLARHGLR